MQGLIAIRYSNTNQAVHILWACVSPENNIYKNGKKRFLGAGAHLFAIAADLSEKYGYDGYVYGEAADRKLLEYYIREFKAVSLPQLEYGNPYRFMLTDISTKKLREVYTYDWTEETI